MRAAWILLFASAILAVCTPSLANSSNGDCPDSLVTKSKNKKDIRKERVLTNRLLAFLGDFEATANELTTATTSAPRSFHQNLEFRQFNELVTEFSGQVQDEINNWDPSSAESNARLEEELAVLERKAKKLLTQKEIWKARETSNLNSIRNNPLAVMPDRVYEVTPDRGSNLKVIFSSYVVEKMFWETKDNVRIRASEASVNAIVRGYSLEHSTNGLNPMTLGNRETMIKVQIIGQAFGAYRVYGFEHQGIIYFVNWEHESNHDSKYLQRAHESTERMFEAYLKDRGIAR